MNCNTCSDTGLVSDFREGYEYVFLCRCPWGIYKASRYPNLWTKDMGMKGSTLALQTSPPRVNIVQPVVAKPVPLLDEQADLDEEDAEGIPW